jgi:hypothetical protein
MARDFGASTRPRWRPGQRGLFLRHWLGEILLVAGFLVFASLPTALALSGSFHADTQPAKVAGGRSCRSISKAEYDRGWKRLPQRFHFGGATFERRRGDADCFTRMPGGLGPPYATCTFTTPVEVFVEFEGRRAWYDVGVGNSAVVDARRQGLNCIVNGRYRP